MILNIILSLSPIIYILYFLYIKRKYNKSISWDISQGLKCYSCKSDIKSFEDMIQESFDKMINIEDMKGEKLCTSCDRDRKINSISFNLFDTYKYNLFIIKNSKRILIPISIFTIFLILDLFFKFNGYRPFFYIGQILQLIYWYSFIKMWKLTSIKNPNQ